MESLESLERLERLESWRGGEFVGAETRGGIKE